MALLNTEKFLEKGKQKQMTFNDKMIVLLIKLIIGSRYKVINWKFYWMNIFSNYQYKNYRLLKGQLLIRTNPFRFIDKIKF